MPKPPGLAPSRASRSNLASPLSKLLLISTENIPKLAFTHTGRSERQFENATLHANDLLTFHCQITLRFIIGNIIETLS
jgi:hypothetical protein